MTDTKTTTAASKPAATSSTAKSASSEEKSASTTKEGKFDREAQQKEIREAIEEENEKQKQKRKDLLSGKITSEEGARPAYEPEPGYSVAMPSPGSIPGGPLPLPEGDPNAPEEYTAEEKEYWQNRQKDGNKLNVPMEK